MKKITLNVYSDPGHGWAKVSIDTLKKLGIAKKISTYSYMRGDQAYLEEDCDLYVLINALKANNIQYSFREFNTNQRSRIRSYDYYRVT